MVPTGYLYETPYGYLGRRAARAVLSESQNHRCCYCGIEMSDPIANPHDPERCTIDHIVPRSRGGTNEWENLVAACSGCNSTRSSMHAIAFFYARLSGKIPSPSASPPQPKARKADGRVVAVGASGQVVAVFLPKSRAFLDQVYGPQTKLSRQAFAELPAVRGISRKARKKATLALVGHDVPFGHFRLPKTSTPAKPIEGATLGSLWPKAG